MDFNFTRSSKISSVVLPLFVDVSFSSCVFLLGIEEDFAAWKAGFVSDIFPVLCGERALTGVCEGRGCECGGGRPDQECCKAQKLSTNTTTPPRSSEVNQHVTTSILNTMKCPFFRGYLEGTQARCPQL